MYSECTFLNIASLFHQTYKSWIVVLMGNVYQASTLQVLIILNPHKRNTGHPKIKSISHDHPANRAELGPL